MKQGQAIDKVRDSDCPQSVPAGIVLPDGTSLLQLTPNVDERGSLTELFRAEWLESANIDQWNLVKSHAGVTRGVHVHKLHIDYIVLLTGRAVVGLSDLRTSSPTYGMGSLVPMSGDDPCALVIPPGVAHGLYFHEPSIQAYGVDHSFHPADEYGCHWLDPQLNINWPVTQALLSDRDSTLPSLKELLTQVSFSTG